MAALEYLTLNSLTSYPFKRKQPANTQTNHPVQDDWFYDILFVSYDDTIRKVFISKLEKTSAGDLKVTFSNIENLEELNEITIASIDLVNHYNNIEKSFASASFQRFSVKFVFGPGLIAKPQFNQTYTYSLSDNYVETELSSGAIILKAPRIDNINFETYDTDRAREENLPDEPFVVAAYPSLNDLPIVVNPRHNSIFALAAVNSGELYVSPGLGAGLYDPCTPKGQITDVFSVNRVTPNSEGSLFLKTSNCYSANVLTANDEILFGDYLDPYREFIINLPGGNTTEFDAVHTDHGISLQNFCKPKCAPETLGAFAHYLNRIEDASFELSEIAFSASEVRGKCSATSANTLNAVFCTLDSANPFVRCSDPAHPEYIDCNAAGFKKYFHEGRTIQIYFSTTNIQEFKIVEVISASSVRVDKSLIGASNLYFRVIDNGVIGNMNCAVSSYNEGTSTLLSPYFKVKYTTTEAYSPSGTYVTYLTLAVAIFNPSSETVGVSLNFSPVKLTRQGDFKVRTKDAVAIVNTPSVTLGCRDYAFIEAVYYINCETYNGSLSIDAFDVTNDNEKIGETYSIANVDGTACPGAGGGTDTSAGISVSYDVSQGAWQNFSQEFSVPGLVSIQSVYGDIPSWLAHTANAQTDKIRLSVTSRPTEEANKTFIVFFNALLTGGANSICRVTLNYAASPVIISPSGEAYTSVFPLIVSKNITYTTQNPLLRILATNMSSQTGTTYSLNVVGGTLPSGLTFNSTTGAITGQVSQQVVDDTTFSILLSCSNAAGTTTNPQTINLAVKSNYPPVISFSSDTPGPVFASSNIITYSSASPLVVLQATNGPILEYSILGELPSGLYFDKAQGKITGRITESSAGTKSVFATARNQYGESSPLQITIEYTIALAPVISSPTNNSTFNLGLYSTTTLASPLFSITATQAFGGTDNFDPLLPEAARNVYSAVGLPSGFSISSNTGKVYGSLSQSEIPTEIPFGYSKKYIANIYATNPVGVSVKSVSIVFSAAAGPIINNIASNSKFTVIKDRVYTINEPLLKIGALGATSFSAENLPAGLSCTSSGYIVGSVQNNAIAKEYTATLKATNTEGTYSLDCRILVPVSIVTPLANATYTLSLNSTYTNIVTVAVCAIFNNEPVTITAENLPDGVVFNNGVLYGTPTTIGSAVVKISATTATLNTSTVNLNINVLNATYSITGTILSPSLVPVAGVRVSVLNDFYYATSNSVGVYEITGLAPGAYRLEAVKDNYYIPATNTATIVDSNVTGINFTATGPARKITGKLTSSGGEPIASAVVNGGIEGAISNDDGSYVLYMAYNIAGTVSATDDSYVFSPGTYNISSGTSNLVNINFTGSPGVVPSEPKDLIITAGNNQLSVAFTPPVTNGGSSITGYEYSLNGADFIQVSATASPIVITGLINGNVYAVRLRAVNAFGTGVISATYTATSNTVPGAPSIISPIYGYDNELVVYFTPNTAYAGVPTLDYEYSTDGGATFRPSGVTSSPLIINTKSSDNTQLLNATVYPVVIRAVNVNGVGAVSLPVNGIPVAGAVGPVIVIGAPTNLTYTPQDKALLVNFTPPTNTGGEAITNYRYSLDNGSNFVTIFPATGAVSSFTILKDHLGQDLVNGQIYQLLVGANTTSTELPSTGNPILAIPGTVPGPPSNISVSAGDKKLVVSFARPTNFGGYPVTDYQYSIDNGGFISTNSTSLFIVLSGLINGQSYSIRLKAVNELGAGTASVAITKTPATEPGAPTIVTPLTILDGGARFDFNEPTVTGGVAISKYQYSIKAGETWLDATVAAPQAGGTGSIQIGDLINGVTYPLRLRAINSSDIVGASSPTLRFIPITTPSAPAITSITQETNTSVSIAFTPPTSNGGSAVTGYKYSLDAGATYSQPLSNLSTLVITGLVQNNAYSVVLKAVNAAGDGLPSNTSSITLYPIYTAPTILEPIVSRNQGFDIIFTPPSNAPYGLGVAYEYSINRGASWSTATVALGETQNTLKIALSGLTNGQEYYTIVRATTSTTKGEASNTVKAIPANPPDAPTQIATTAADSQIIVRFTPPANDGGSAITDYKYSLNDSEFISSGKTASPITISPLRNGAAYYIRLAAVNSAGMGSPSVTPQTPTMPGISPDNPTNVIVAANSDAKAVISFTAGDSGSSPITDYEYSIDAGVTWISGATTTSPITTNSSTLVNGTTYNFQIRARSLVGTSLGTTSITKLWGLPNAPINVKYHTITPTTISAQFTSPQLSWQPSITSYQYSINGGTNWTTLPTGNTLPLSITGLTKGSTYKISVRAINSIGTGESAIIQTIVLGVPAPPTVELVELEIHDPQGSQGSYYDSQTVGYARALNIYFTPPAYDGGYPITNYEYSLNGGLTFTAANDTRSPLNINIPYPYIATTGNTLVIPTVTEYSIVLRSVNSLGKSIASEKYIDISRIPTAPLITGISAKNNAATIYFNPPLLMGSDSILRYEYTIGLAGSQTTSDWIDSGVNSSPIQITGLTSATEYEIMIRAVNSNNLTSLSNIAGRLETLGAMYVYYNFSTPLGNAGPPTSNTPSIITGSNKLTIPWTVSNTGGYTPWKLEYSLNGGLTYIQSNNATSPLVIDSGLTYGTKYDIRLRLLTVTGSTTPPGSYYTQIFTGEPFSVGVVTTMSDGPDAPTITGYTTTFSSSAVSTTTISFAPPGLGLDQVLGYQYSLDNGDTWTATPSVDPLALSFSITNIGHKSLLRLRSVVSTGFGEESLTKLILLPPSRPIVPEVELFAYRSGGLEYYDVLAEANNPSGGMTQEDDGCYRYNLRFLNTIQRRTPNPPIDKYMISVSDDGVSYGDWVDLTGETKWDGTGAMIFLTVPGQKSMYNCFYKRLDFPKTRTYFIANYYYDGGTQPSDTFTVPAELCLPAQATDFTSFPFVASYDVNAQTWVNHVKYIKIRACNSVGCSDATAPFLIEYLSIT